MAIKTYGKISFDQTRNNWRMDDVQPHVCIKLKSVFPKINKTQVAPFFFSNTLEMAADLSWFIDRYPFSGSESDLSLLKQKMEAHGIQVQEVESIFLSGYIPTKLNADFKGNTPRPYQLKGNDLLLKVNSYLLGDDLGLGKTVTAILGLFNDGSLPAAVVCQTHLATHWIEQIAKFSDLTTHVIKTRSAYSLPPADVYIFAYSRLQGWADVFSQSVFKYVIFDEIAELRHMGTSKYAASSVLIQNATRAIGLSATPVYNYGDEIFSIINILKPGSLGPYHEFLREWCTPIGANKYKVVDPKSLGTYLRDNYLMLRRTRAEVGMELPEINTIIHEIEYDEDAVNTEMDLLKMLAVTLTSGAFSERGEAAREIDLRMRHITGVSKAAYVAEFTKILLDNDEAVLLAGWHRDVYDIWRKSFADYNPVWYTGTESVTQKNASKAAFVNGETKLMIISLVSGIGLDGFQDVCSNVVLGELHYSPQVHKQLIARLDRPGQKNRVTAFYPVSNGGSDPAMINILGLKSSQAFGIVDPGKELAGQYSDDSRIKAFAEIILNRHKK